MAFDQWRCEKCHRILAEVNNAPGQAVRIKCPHCDTWNTLRVAGHEARPSGPGQYEKRLASNY